MPPYVVCPSIRPSVTLMYADHVGRVTSNVITLLISPVSQHFADVTSAI